MKWKKALSLLLSLKNLKLTVIGGTADAVAAEYTFSTVKVAATKGNVKIFNVANQLFKT